MKKKFLFFFFIKSREISYKKNFVSFHKFQVLKILRFWLVSDLTLLGDLIEDLKI
jgi:hypothetical protein